MFSNLALLNKKTTMITYEDFTKLDIRIGTILSVKKVPETDKLVILKIDLGEDKPRQLVAGIVEYISNLETLIGKQIPILTNLEPRTIKGIESQGMILAVSTDSDDTTVPFSLLVPLDKIKNGSKVH